MPERNIDILSLGEPLLEFNQLSEAGRQIYLPGFGGDTSNVAVAAARQGASVGYVTRLGGDPFGDRFMALWEAEGIDTSCVARDSNAPTGIYFVTHGPSGHQFTYFRKGSAASRMTPTDLPREAIAHASVLHASGISQAISESACDAVFEAIAIARANGVTVSYDTNLRLKLWPLARARAIILESISLADVCLPSLEDASALLGTRDPDAIVDALLGKGAGVVALKMGPDGALVANKTERQRLSGHQVDAIDATGAGDTFDGAFIAMLLEGRSLREAAVYANAAAALSTTGYGAVQAIPRRSDVEHFLKQRRDDNHAA
jgi:2-dehydro-3-deoxygluconokinase